MTKQSEIGRPSKQNSSTNNEIAIKFRARKGARAHRRPINAREGRLRAHALKRKKGPRGDRIPPRALLAFMGLCARAPFRARGPAARGLVLRSGAPFPACGAFPRSEGRMLFRLLSASTRYVAGMRFADVAGMRNAKLWIAVPLGRLRTCALRGGGRLRRSLFHCGAHCFASSFHSSGKYGVSCTFLIR